MEPEKTFKPGDIVHLASGPRLTVEACKDGLAKVVWFDHAHQVQRAEFAVEILTRLNAP